MLLISKLELVFTDNVSFDINLLRVYKARRFAGLADSYTDIVLADNATFL